MLERRSFLHGLRRRLAAWREREAVRAAPGTLAQRVGEIRRLLSELERQVAGLEAEVAMGESYASGRVST